MSELRPQPHGDEDQKTEVEFVLCVDARRLMPDSPLGAVNWPLTVFCMQDGTLRWKSEEPPRRMSTTQPEC